MIRDRLLQYAARLRYPKLLVLALVLFIVDLIVPDFIPFADEILLGLISLLLAGLKKRNVRIENEDP
jgi:hypothetical protein